MNTMTLCIFIMAFAITQALTCPSGQVYVKFIKKTSTAAAEESWEIYSSGTKIYTSPTLENSSTRTIEECFAASTNYQYTIKIKDSFGDSWSGGAYLQIEGVNGNRIMKHIMFESSEEEFPLSLYSPINKNDQWKFISGSTTDNWNAYSFADSTWTEQTLGSVEGTFTGTQYFRKTFTGIASMAAYEFGLRYRYGIIAYINGFEIQRDNMPDGPATSSTTAAGLYSKVEYHSFIRPGTEVANAQSVLAVEVHFTSATSSNAVDFNGYLALYTSTIAGSDLCYSYPYDITYISTVGSNPNLMGDYNKSTYYYITNSSQYPGTVTLYLTGPISYINGVTVYPYTYPNYAPSNYKLQGTNNPNSASSWKDVIIANELIYESKVFLTTKSYFSSKLYNTYRFVYNTPTSTTNMYAYEMYPLVCAHQVPTTIEFPSTSYSYYAKYEEVSIKPLINELSSCTINPQPPAGLSFDTTTCSLSGKATGASSATYTVSTTTATGQSISGSFTLQIVDCAGTIISALRTYQNEAYAEAFTIKDAATNTVVMEVTANSGQYNNVDWTSIICVTGSKYTVSVSSTLNNYWMYGSFLYINAMIGGVNDYETILRVKFDNYIGLPQSYTFNAQYSIKPFETWNYKMGEVPANWYSSDMSGWATASSGTFPASSNQIQIYKKTFNVASLNDVAGFVVTFKYRYGYIIYVNNHEAARKGVVGDLSASSFASTSYSEVGFHQISLPIKTMSDGTSAAVDYITTGTNTIAIALVAANPSQTTSNFDCAVRLMGTESVSRVWDVTSSMSGITGATLFFNFCYTYQIYQQYCDNNSLQITFDNDRREWISSIVFKLHYTQTSQHPRQVTIKAKNPEDASWTTIKTVTGMTWSLAGQANRVWLTNNKAYNQYRFENFATGDTNNCYWRLGMIDLRSDATQVVVPALTYPVTSIYKDIEMGEVYPSSELYTEFTVNPPLPAGIRMDPYTGAVSGVAGSIVSSQAYTVTAKKFNTGETVTAQFNLAVEICTGGRSLITLVARSDGNPSQQSWKVYQGKGTTGTVVYQAEELSMTYSLNYGDFCLNHGIYTLQLSGDVDGWDMSSGYYLTVDVGAMKFEMGFVESSSVTTMFSSFLPFQIEYDDWKVYKDINIAEDWKSLNFDDSTWTVTKAPSIGTNEAITTYIRRDIMIDDISNYHVLNVRVKYAGGVVAYFNGRKVARFNLIDEFDAETESLSSHDAQAFSQFHVILNTVGAVTGKNVIAFEIHRPYGQSSAEPVVFDATGIFGVNDCSPVLDTIINVSGTPTSVGNSMSDLNNFFDFHPEVFGFQPNAVGTYLQWSVENLEGTRFNHLAFMNPIDVTGWAFSLYGRETESLVENPNTEEYTDMFEQIGIHLNAMSRNRFPIPVGIAGFRQFKHEVDDAASATVHINTYLFEYCKASGAGVCPGIDDYPPVGEGQVSPAECAEGYRGYAYRTCSGGVLGTVHTDKCIFKLPARLNYESTRYVMVKDTSVSIAAPRYQNIIQQFYLADNTQLPAGLVLDSTTGAITGKPTVEKELTAYTIFGQNPAGVTSTVIEIQVRMGECKADGNFPLTHVGSVAVYKCSTEGAYMGTQKRACVLGARDGEWQKVEGVCVSIVMVVLLVIVAIVIVAVVVFFASKKTKTTKAVGGVKGKKAAGKTQKPKAGAKKATKSVKV